MSRRLLKLRASMRMGVSMTSGCCPLLALLLLLLMFPPLSLQDSSTPGAEEEAFIKVTRFQVPGRVRLGERVHLACHYELSGETLHAMKLYKDGNEFYRFTPGSRQSGHEEPAQRLAFGQPGVQVELQLSNERDVWLKPATKNTSGTYKCQVIVENTFKSISVERQLEVRNRSLGPVVMDNYNNSQQHQQQSRQHPRQRHAVQHQNQQHHLQQTAAGGGSRQQQQSDGNSQSQNSIIGMELASSLAFSRWHLQLSFPELLLLLALPTLFLAGH